MLNEMLLTTTLCVAIVGVMALFYGELELLQNNHYLRVYGLTPLSTGNTVNAASSVLYEQSTCHYAVQDFLLDQGAISFHIDLRHQFRL